MTEINANNKRWVCVYRGFDYQESRLIKMLMERENIQYYIKNEFGAYMPTGSKIMELFVEEDNSAACITILRTELGLE